MGLVSEELLKVQAPRIYLDANIFIYALEGIQPYAKELRPIFERIDAGELVAVTSELSLAECLVQPYLENDTARQLMFEKTLTSSTFFEVVPVSRAVLKDAAVLRATHSSLRMPDAIHLASAIFHQCSVFLTNDSRIKNIPDIRLLVLRDFSTS